MQNRQNLTCAIIGSGTLPVRCAEILAAKNHTVTVVASADAPLKNYSAEAEIPHLDLSANLAEQLRRFRFDYLLSIVNERILRADILSQAQTAAINYHDAPLPRYAGTHATSWALLNGETAHGVSWHFITETIDAGAVVESEKVAVAENETAWTLNAKCYEAAALSFGRLIDALADGNLAPQKQNLQKRTFFSRHRKPSGGGVISWENSATEIARTVRALNFGAHLNYLAAAKIQLRDKFFIVTEIEISENAARGAAGTITKIGTDFLQIAAADRELILRKLTDLAGQPVAIADLAADFELSQGGKIASPTESECLRIENLFSASAADERFWAAKLSGLQPPEIPYMQCSAPPARQIIRRKIVLPPEVLRLLRRETNWRKDRLTLAAFAVLLGRLSGASCFDLGYTDAEIQSRSRPFDHLFAAVLPLRCEPAGLKSFRDFYAETARHIEIINRRKFFALDVVGRVPTLKKHFAAYAGCPLPAVFATVKKIEDVAAKNPVPLKVIAAEDDAEAIFCEFESARFSENSISKIIAHFVILLREIAAAPDCKIGRLPILPESERDKILFEWNDAEAKFPQTANIQQLFEAQVERTPDAAALIFGADRISYSELNRRANRIANYLRKLGARPETLTAIALERSVEMIAGILGILKSGAAYVPLDPHYPRERIELMLADSNAPFLLTNEKTLRGLKNPRAQAICLDRDRQAIERESADNPASPAAPENLAYVIYTSGSTGKPKGVAIEHRSAIAFLHWALTVYSTAQLKGVLASTSVCFDLSIFEIFAPLSCGGALILVENALGLKDAAAKNEVTLINTVPSAITELLRTEAIPASAKTINLAGEPLKTALVKQIYALDTVERVFDLYGPTEDTTYSTFTLRGEGAATIGRPIANTQAYILDEFLQPVPVGIAGELFLSGAGLARGYLNRPELTAEKFIKNPFAVDAAARMYRTGDLARHNERGEIVYLGRIDHQVKIRGFRVELGEIEARLSAHPQIRETIVLAREDNPPEKRLVAYYVPRKKQSPEHAELRRFLQQTLPDYMIPSAFVAINAMPLTPNGKIDRRELPAPAANRFAETRKMGELTDALETKLVNIWETILDVQPIGTRDDFFELGGHSLQAVRMFAEIEKSFNVNIPLAALFQAGTIEKLAAILRKDGWNAPESSLVPIQPKGAKPIFFCVHAKGGNVLFYRDLARRLGADQPFYGIQARRLGGRQVGHSDLKEMADFYIREIKTLQPAGPYFLGGSSFGGLAAFEMAQQLKQGGEKVALLALLDTGTPDYPQYLPETSGFRRRIYRLARRVQHHRDNLRRLGTRAKFSYAAGKIAKVKLKYRRQIRDAYKKTVRKFYVKTKGAAAIPHNYIQLEDLIRRAGESYQPQLYTDDVTIFRAALQPLGIVPDETLGWREYVGGRLEIHDVPGHHGSIVVEPDVATLAEKLKDCLEEIYRRQAEASFASQSPNPPRRAAIGV